MTKDELITAIRAYLGDGVVGVELTPAQLDVVVGSSLRWLSRFFKRTGSLTLTPASGQSKFDLSGLPYGAEVVDVRRAPVSSPPSYFLEDDIYPFHESAPDVGEYAIGLNYSEVARKMLGRDPVWKYDPPYLYISPPAGDGETVKVYYTLPLTAVEDVPDKFLVPLVEYAKGEAKEILGRIRGKYRGVPAPEGQVELDADVLLQEAREDKERAEEMVRKLVPSAGFVVG